MEKFEYFIIKNKDLFNNEKIDKNVWKNIYKNFQNQNLKKKTYLRIAASFAIFVVISYFIFYSIKQNTFNNNYKEFREVKKYYNSLITSKYTEIEKISKNNPILIKEIEINFKILDSIYYVLQKDMKEKISNRVILEAMIQNYQKKLYILDKILSQIKDNDESNLEENNNQKSYDL